MTETKFTPGPWAFVPTEYLSHDAPGVWVAVADGGIIGGTEDDPHWVVQGADTIDWAPNAHLIAAAPDLYAALKSLLEVPEQVGEEFVCIDYISSTDSERLFQKARAALAKARGE